MNNQNIFYSIIAGFTSGIFLSSFFKMGFSFFMFLLLLSIVVFIFSKLISKTSVKIILLAIFIFSFSLGILRYEIKEIRDEEGNLSQVVGQKVILTGLVFDEPSIKEKGVQSVVIPEKISVLGKIYRSSEKVLVTAGFFPEFKYGDIIQVEGKLEKPENFSTGTSDSFDYVNYLAKDEIFYTMNFVQIKVLSTGQGSYIKSKLFTFKNAFMSRINLLIKEPESSLLGGLLLGAKNSLGQELQNNFRLAGVSHIVALSGYNITIVAESIMIALSFLPRFFSVSFGVLGILLFAIMTGGGATVMRASVMALLAILAKSTGRTYDITRALLLAGVFMLVQNPKILVFDVSFQLSFLATLALILVSPIVEKRMTFITEKYHLRELIVSSVATQIFVLPFLLYKMGLISVFALLTNLLVLPVIPIIMFLGFLIGIIGFVSLTLATPLAFVCSLMLSYMLKVIDVIAHWPLSSITVKTFPIILLIIFYLIIFIIIWCSRKDFPQPSSLH